MVTTNGTIHYILKLNILKHYPVLTETYLFINTFCVEIILILCYMYMNLEPGEVLIQIHALHNTWPVGKEGSIRINDLSILSFTGNIKWKCILKYQRKYLPPPPPPNSNKICLGSKLFYCGNQTTATGSPRNKMQAFRLELIIIRMSHPNVTYTTI